MRTRINQFPAKRQFLTFHLMLIFDFKCWSFSRWEKMINLWLRRFTCYIISNITITLNHSSIRFIFVSTVAQTVFYEFSYLLHIHVVYFILTDMCFAWNKSDEPLKWTITLLFKTKVRHLPVYQNKFWHSWMKINVKHTVMYCFYIR